VVCIECRESYGFGTRVSVRKRRGTMKAVVQASSSEVRLLCEGSKAVHADVVATLVDARLAGSFFTWLGESRKIYW